MFLNAVQKILPVLILLFVETLYAQQPALDSLVARVFAANPELRVQGLIELERTLNEQLARASRQPTVDLKSDYLLSAGGRRIAFPVGDLFNPAYATLNQLTQSNSFPTDLENVDEQFLPNNFHDTRFEVRYPLLAPQIERETALRAAQTAEAREQTRVLENQLRGQTRDLFYAVQQARAGQRIVDSARVVLTELLRVNRSLVRNDLRTSDVVSRTEAELADLDARRADLVAQEAIATGALNRLLHQPLNTPLTRPNETTIPPLPDPAALDDLLAAALTDRPEFAQLDAGDRALLALDALQEAGGKPTLGAFLNAGAQGFLGGDLGEHPYATVGVGFAWNLYDGKKRDLHREITDVQRQQLAARRTAAEDGIGFEVWRAYQTLTGERARLDALGAGVRAAEASLRILESKYRNQNALLVEYLDARNDLTTKQLEANLSRWRYWQNYGRLLTAVGR